ncbi:uncharacterized protein LOC127282488 [Leptopilina boulardi]|uniref:uncharacterized protein LOC127282488 n=1 Tax=Leptopilina boulardi TaxID=63433 RepID=UPI0021F516B5|nr:uncharacterized protein LOC127282488 [Leptopilina boulardi]
MHLSSNKKREDVAIVIRSLLTTYQDGVTIRRLAEDYEEVECEPIPFKEFNCPTLYSFLQELQNYVRIERVNNQTLLFPVITDKTKHIAEFVKNQRSKNPNRRKFQRPFLGYCANKSQVTINKNLLTQLVQCVYLYPHGVPMFNVILFLNQHIYPLQITKQELERQLNLISHLVIVCGDKLYPKHVMPIFPQQFLTNYAYNNNNNNNWTLHGNYNSQNSNIIRQQKPVQNSHIKPNIVPVQNSKIQPNIIQEEKSANFIEKSNKTENKIPLLVKGANDVYKLNEELKTLISEITEKCEIKSDKNDIPLKECQQENMSTNIKIDDENSKPENSIKSDRDLTIFTTIRLSKLIQKFPNGIWCSELTKLYLQEYNSPLLYSEKEFSSLLDFVYHLPKIFHCVKPLNEKDYKLFNAKNNLPHLKNDKKSNIPDYSHDYDDFKSSLLKEVMGIDDTVKQLSVTEFKLNNDNYEEITISHVISPSYFWIHLRKNFQIFNTFNNEIMTFYVNYNFKYKVPFSLMQKGLNVVCFFKNKWNRGLIKDVCKDSQITIFLYDYGMDKKFFPDEICFLHKSFANFPAQAIPCCLYNVKPYKSSNWSHDILWQFISKSSFPLIATVHDINLEENLLFLVLTDTRTDQDFHINDWLCKEKFAEPGQYSLEHHNYVFSHYKECLKQKGYDPFSLHYNRLNHDDDNDDNNEINDEIPIVESENKHYPLRLKNLLASYVNLKIDEDNLPKLKKITTTTDDKSTDESTKSSNCSRLMSLRKMNNLKSLNCNEKEEEEPSTSRSITDDSISTSSLEESQKKITIDMPYFGTFASECGGRGRMESIDWKNVLNTDNYSNQKQIEKNVSKNLPPQLQRLLRIQNEQKQI